VRPAKPHDAPPFYLLPAVPGLGQLVRVVLLYESHAITRVPRGQALVASGRVVKCTKESAGKREGTSGTKIGHASLQGACSEAALLCLRNPPAGQT
jgi:hypothetical protein